MQRSGRAGQADQMKSKQPRLVTGALALVLLPTFAELRERANAAVNDLEVKP